MMVEIFFIYICSFFCPWTETMIVYFILFKILYSIQLESKCDIEKRIASIVYLCL